MSESTFNKAIDLLTEFPHRDSKFVRQGSRGFFDHYVTQLIDEEVRFDPEQEQISRQSVGEKIEQILKDVADEDEPYREFQRRIREYSTEIIRSAHTEYEVLFPLNLKDYQPIPSEFEASGLHITRIGYEDWKVLVEDAKSQKVILDVFDQARSNPYDEEYTYWKAEVTARDGSFALGKVRFRVEALLGGILFSFKKWNLPGRARPDDLPRTRPSRVKEPWVYLCRDSEAYRNVILSSYEYQEPVVLPWSDEEYTNRLDNIPVLDGSNEFDKLLLDAFRTYYYGMTSRDRGQSFFHFIRGVDYLSQTDRSRRIDEAVTRALFAYEQVDGSELNTVFESIVEGFSEVRNNLAHEGANTQVEGRQQQYSKILLDSLISFYLACYGQFTLKEVSDLLKYGPQTTKKKELLEKYEQVESFHIDE